MLQANSRNSKLICRVCSKLHLVITFIELLSVVARRHYSIRNIGLVVMIGPNFSQSLYQRLCDEQQLILRYFPDSLPLLYRLLHLS